MLNLRALFQEIPEARQYIESGVLAGSKTVTVYSLAHVQTYVNGDYERGTLKSPFDFSTLPDECTPISKPVAAAESPEGEESAQPSTPPSTEFIPTTLADLGVDTKRFVVAPEVIIQFEDQILRHWTNKILDDYLQREILAEHNHRGMAVHGRTCRRLPTGPPAHLAQTKQHTKCLRAASQKSWRSYHSAAARMQSSHAPPLPKQTSSRAPGQA